MRKLSHGPSLCKKAVIPYGRIDLLNLWKKYSNLTHTKFTCQQNRKRILQIQRQETKISFFFLFSFILPVKTVKIIKPKTKMNTNKQEPLCCPERQGGCDNNKKFPGQRQNPYFPYWLNPKFLFHWFLIKMKENETTKFKTQKSIKKRTACY